MYFQCMYLNLSFSLYLNTCHSGGSVSIFMLVTEFNNVYNVNRGNFGLCLTSVTVYVWEHPSAPQTVPVSLLSCVLEVPVFTSLKSLSPVHTCHLLSDFQSRTVASPPPHQLNSPSLSSSQISL